MDIEEKIINGVFAVLTGSVIALVVLFGYKIKEVSNMPKELVKRIFVKDVANASDAMALETSMNEIIDSNMGTADNVEFISIYTFYIDGYNGYTRCTRIIYKAYVEREM